MVSLLEQGEHGYLAARVASQVIRAYVDKQRTRENNTLKSAQAKDANKPVDAAGVWGATETGSGAAGSLNGGTWTVMPGVSTAACRR